MGATLLVCDGAWSAGWAWKKMHPLMAAAWRYHEIDASHAPNVTAPEALMTLLQQIAAEPVR